VWATRVHAAAARARQNEHFDQSPDESWDQRAPELAPRAAAPRSRSSWQSLRPQAAEAKPAFSRAPARSSSRAPEGRGPSRAPEGRTVDYSAFDDVPSRSAAPSAGGLPRGTRVFHRRFGSGVVEQSEGPDKVVARFKGFGSKKVLLEYLTLKES
jgi:hypothetical protein